MNIDDIRRREQFMMHDINQRNKADWIFENDSPEKIDQIIEDLIESIEDVEDFTHVIERS